MKFKTAVALFFFLFIGQTFAQNKKVKLDQNKMEQQNIIPFN